MYAPLQMAVIQGLPTRLSPLFLHFFAFLLPSFNSHGGPRAAERSPRKNKYETRA